MNKKGEIQGGGGKPGKKALKKSDSTQKGNSVEDEMREKILSAVLTGINRAIPFTNTNDEFFERHMDSLFRITHSFNLNTSLQALMLLQQLSVSHQGVSDRFYRTLYESLLDPRLLTSSKHILYLDLLFRALRNDLDLKRVKAFAKRLLQVASLHQPPFACGILYLLRELEKVFPSLSMFIDQPEEKLEDEEEVFYDVSNDFSDDRRQESIRQGQKESLYDGRKRAPQHSNADKSCLWELVSSGNLSLGTVMLIYGGCLYTSFPPSSSEICCQFDIARADASET
jgi:ribosome biogenesis protein MAK21